MSKKRDRQGNGPYAGGDDSIDASVVDELRKFVKKEEAELRKDTVDTILNRDLVERIKTAKELEAEVYTFESHQVALDAGFVKKLRGQLHKVHRMGMQMESWLNTFAPPLSAGGNAAVSSEVQESIFSHIHTLTSDCSDTLHRMLAFEKEYALMKIKSKDCPEVFTRYLLTLDENLLHDLRKSCLSMTSNLMMVANTITTNLSHLSTHTDTEKSYAGTLY